MSEQKLHGREWLIRGGSGHEDGADGLRAAMWSSETVIEALDDYREYLLEAALAAPPATGESFQGMLERVGAELRAYGALLQCCETRDFSNEFDAEHGQAVEKLADDAQLLFNRLVELRDGMPHAQHTVWKDGIDIEECWPHCPRCQLTELLEGKGK